MIQPVSKETGFFYFIFFVRYFVYKMEIVIEIIARPINIRTLYPILMLDISMKISRIADATIVAMASQRYLIFLIRRLNKKKITAAKIQDAVM